MSERGESAVLAQVRELENTEFEEFVAALWELQDWTTVVTPASNDHGFDVVASREFPLPLKIHIQAKRYGPDTKVTGPELQDYIGLAVHREVNVVAVVTSGSFTGPARSRATDYNQLKLVNGDTLVELIQQLDAQALLEEYLHTRDWDKVALEQYMTPIYFSDIPTSFPVYTNKDQTRVAEEHDGALSAASTTSGTSEEAVDRRTDQPVTALPGIGEKSARKLSKNGIETISDLRAADPTDIAEETGLSDDRLATWISEATTWDGGPLTLIPRIGPEYEAALKNIGIDAVGELANADPEDVAAHTDISRTELTKWILEAAYRKGDYETVRQLHPCGEKDPDVLPGIGQRYASKLEAAGLTTLADLAIAEPKVVDKKTNLTASQIERWGQAARYYSE